jgi:hypothetical protein
MAREHQGIAASLVSTAVNYSISIGLGMAGTVEKHVNNGGLDVLKGYRGAWYLGIGLGAVGIAMSVCFILFGSPRVRQMRQVVLVRELKKSSRTELWSSDRNDRQSVVDIHHRLFFSREIQVV